MTEKALSAERGDPLAPCGAPHPPLPGYYRENETRDGFVRDLFNRTADSYDRINATFSFGSGAWYRRRALLQAGLRPGARVIDVAVGTGLVAREAVRITGRPSDVVGLDVSEGMLAQARRQLAIPLVQGRAEALPFADGSVDFVSIGYALRHVADLSDAFVEFLRILKPGGRLLILEVGRPRNRIGYAMLRSYLGRVVPTLSRRLGRESAETLMRYYWDTIEACVPPSVIMSTLEKAGAVDVSCRREFGIFHAYVAGRGAGRSGVAFMV